MQTKSPQTFAAVAQRKYFSSSSSRCFHYFGVWSLVRCKKWEDNTTTASRRKEWQQQYKKTAGIFWWRNKRSGSSSMVLKRFLAFRWVVFFFFGGVSRNSPFTFSRSTLLRCEKTLFLAFKIQVSKRLAACGFLQRFTSRKHRNFV